MRLLITRAATRAILEQSTYYAKRENQELANRWEVAVDRALRSLPKEAGRGSRCDFHHPELQHLRRIPVPGFPQHLIFYEERPEQALIRVVQVVHGARDIEALLTKRLPS
jgi:toxin ParE1/3/4